LFDRGQMLVRKLLDLGVDRVTIDFRGVSACLFQRGTDRLLELLRVVFLILSSSSSAARASATDVSAKLRPTASTSTTMRVRVELLSAPFAARITVSISPPVRLTLAREFVLHFLGSLAVVLILRPARSPSRFETVMLAERQPTLDSAASLRDIGLIVSARARTSCTA